MGTLFDVGLGVCIKVLLMDAYWSLMELRFGVDDEYHGAQFLYKPDRV